MITVPMWSTWNRGVMVGFSDATADAPGGWAELDTYDIMLDDRGYDRKPDRRELRRINGRILDGKVTVNVYQLAAVLSKGYTVLPAICWPQRKAEHWKAQRLFFLDFDNDEAAKKRGYPRISMWEALKRGCLAGYRPVLAYPSFSSGESLEYQTAYTGRTARFRIVFDAGVAYTDRAERDRYAAGLALLYPEADRQSLEPNRMFLGTCLGVIECTNETRF